MVMFGLAVTSALLILVVGDAVFGGILAAGTAHGFLLAVFSDFGWALFIGLFLGWLAAMAGAFSAHKVLSHAAVQQEVRHA
jgi:hypothetical protein